MHTNILNKRVVVLLFVTVIIFLSCVKNSTTTPPVTDPTVAQTIKNGTNLTLFNAALIRTGLDTVLNTDSMVTVFVVTDQIMGNYGLGATVIDTMSIGRLDTILLYHILTGEERLSTTFINGGTGQNVSTQMASGDSVFVTYMNNVLYVNGISVPTTDVKARNGYLDVLAQPLFPPAGTILQVIQADTALSFFDSAVALTASAGNNIMALLTNGNIYTVFVPNNNAFRNAGYPSVDTVNPNTLANFLSYHIIAGRYFTSDMNIALANPLLTTDDTTRQVTISTLPDSAIKVTLGLSYQVEGAADSVAANLYAPNIMARNGVIHKIDRVLLQ
ncbi:MAG TPA: fasciclin domain-containing protein [Puia sp.]|nr:fasciclin domain-containing protein [Puia sp.]